MGFSKVLDKFDANQKVVLEKFEGLETNYQELLAVLSCLPRAFGSVATGLREAAAGGPVRAMVAASPAEVAAWLKEVGLEQYENALAPLGGAGLLVQTPASLMHLGVLPGHVAPLLDKIIKAA